MKGTKMRVFSRKDFGITLERTNWGSPRATLELPRELSQYAGWNTTFVLQSTEGCPDIPGSDKPTNGNGIVVLAGGAWLGTREYFDIERAIDELVDYLTAETVKDDFAQEWELLTAAENAFTEFKTSLEWGSRRDYLAQWAEVRKAVAAVEVRLNSDLNMEQFGGDGYLTYRFGSGEEHTLSRQRLVREQESRTNTPEIDYICHALGLGSGAPMPEILAQINRLQEMVTSLSQPSTYPTMDDLDQRPAP